MKNKLLLIPFALIFLFSFIQAGEVLVFSIYDETPDYSLTMINGDSFGLTITARSVGEPSMDILVEIVDESGNVLKDLIDVHTTSDFYYNHEIFANYVYNGNSGEYTIKTIVTGQSGSTDSEELKLIVLESEPTNNRPQIVSTPLTESKELEFYSYQVVATDKDNDNLTYKLIQNPEWLSISSSGLISGMTQEVEVDTQFVVTVEVSDGKEFVRQTFPLDVFNILLENHAPVAQNLEYEISKNESILILLQATDEDNDNLTYSVVSYASNGLINNYSNQVIYFPNPEFVGVDSFTYKVNDGKEDSNIATVTITIKENEQDNEAPIITVISPKDKKYDSSEILFKITTNEPAEAWFYLDGVNYSMNRDGTTFDLEVDLEDGDYLVIFYAQDTAGNTANKSVKFKIDTEKNSDKKKSLNNFVTSSPIVEEKIPKIVEEDSENEIKIESSKTNWILLLILIFLLIDLVMLLLIKQIKRK